MTIPVTNSASSEAGGVLGLPLLLTACSISSFSFLDGFPIISFNAVFSFLTLLSCDSDFSLKSALALLASTSGDHSTTKPPNSPNPSSLAFALRVCSPAPPSGAGPPG